jgi:hypothetical protein
MFNPIRSVLPAIAALMVVGVILNTPIASGTVAGGRGRARAARTLSVHDLAKTHLVNASGDTLIEEGRAFGSLPGSARVTLSFNGSTTTSRFTFHLSGGSISGRGRAKLHSGNGHYESFGGTATIIGGTGRYAHISGNGGFYGVLDRSNSNAEVQVTGNLHM